MNNTAVENRFSRNGFGYYTISYPFTGSDLTKKKTFVLIHGLLMDPRFWWKDHVALFQEYGDVHSISLTGHYPSTIPRDFKGKIDASFIVQMIEDQLSELGVEVPVVLVGHSTGALAAMIYAIQRGKRIEALGILSSTPHGRESAGIYSFFQFLNRKGGAFGRFCYKGICKANSLSLSVHKFLLGDVAYDKKAMFAYPGFDDWIANYFPHNKKLVAENSGVWLRDLYDIDITSQLGEIKVPTLVMFSEFDPYMDKSYVESYKEQLKSVEALDTKVLPKTGHLYMFESAKEFNRSINQWLASL